MFYDRVSFTTATTGTGPITAGAATAGYSGLNTADDGVPPPDGTEVDYSIKDGVNWETGKGIVGASGTTLTRIVSRSTNSNTAINLSGTATVFLTVIAETLNEGLYSYPSDLQFQIRPLQGIGG